MASIVVKPEHRNIQVIELLFDALYGKILELMNQGLIISSVLADAITDEGKHMSKLLGMRKITQSNHDSEIYEINMVPPDFPRKRLIQKQVYEVCLQKCKELD